MLNKAHDLSSAQDFEFASLDLAANYRASILREFGHHLRGRILEVGAGIGHYSALLAQSQGVKDFLALEPETRFRLKFQQQHPTLAVSEGTLATFPKDSHWDTIVCINVLEHILDDETELRRCFELLAKRRGYLCLLVPARKEIYAPIDRTFGHHRRYNRRELRHKLVRAGFSIVRLNYFNFIGYFGWWFNFCLLKKTRFDEKSVIFFDRFILPWAHGLERTFIRPPFGQSLLAVAHAA